MPSFSLQDFVKSGGRSQMEHALKFTAGPKYIETHPSHGVCPNDAASSRSPTAPLEVASVASLHRRCLSGGTAW